MRIVLLDHVQEGMKVAKSIYGSNGETLLGAGVCLTSFYIQRLRELNIVALYIEDEEMGDIEVNDVISERTRLEAIKITKDFMSKIRFNSNVDIFQVKQVLTSIVDELSTNKNVMVQVLEIRSLNDHTFSHSVNVAILSVITGIAMGYDREKLKELALGALFHDIGRTLLPESILFKTEPLTQEEENLWKEHPKMGYDILRKLNYFTLTAAHVALQHHERYDGKGFPRGLKGKKISELARVVTVCDRYDKLTTYQGGQPHCQPFQAIEILIANCGLFFDQDVVKVFLSIIAMFPIGSSVILNTGEKGIVVETDKEYPTRPNVRLLFNKEGEKLFPPYEIELITNPQICIVRIAEEGLLNG